MIKMAFNSEGQLLGFELRVDMFPIAFEFDEYNFKIVIHLMKTNYETMVNVPLGRGKFIIFDTCLYPLIIPLH